MRSASLSLALLLSLSACTGDTPEAPDQTSGPTVGTEDVGFGGELRGTVDTVVANESGEVEVGVTDEVMFFRLSDSAQADVRKDVEGEVPEDGFGAAIGNALSGVVETALATTIQVNLDNVEAVTYENGRLRIETDEDTSQFNVNEDDDEGLRFDADAAQRLIAAFERNR